MIPLPLREAVARTAVERAERAACLRRILGPADGWTEDQRVELLERLANSELDGGVDRATAEREAADAVRLDLLRRLT